MTVLLVNRETLQGPAIVASQIRIACSYTVGVKHHGDEGGHLY